MTTLHELEQLSAKLPLALKRGHVVYLFSKCGLGGDEEYRRQKKKGAIVRLQGLPGTTHPRFSKEKVVAMCAESLKETSTQPS